MSRFTDNLSKAFTEQKMRYYPERYQHNVEKIKNGNTTTFTDDTVDKKTGEIVKSTSSTTTKIDDGDEKGVYQKFTQDRFRKGNSLGEKYGTYGE